jgi:hypothetical protein
MKEKTDTLLTRAQKLLNRFKRSPSPSERMGPLPEVVVFESRKFSENKSPAGISRSQIVRDWVDSLMARGMTEQEALDHILGRRSKGEKPA